MKNSNWLSTKGRLLPFKLALVSSAVIVASLSAQAEIAATHIYHNHMPNFWPYYDTSTYEGLSNGSPIRYTYDGQVKELKKSPPPTYTFYLPGTSQAMPHDDIESYYSHHAKTGAYLSWPMDTAKNNQGNHPLSQTQVTMSASVINNVQSFAELGNQSGYNLGWGDYWRNTQNNVKTASGEKALDTIHFAGHHTMGPLVGNDYFLKDLIYQNVTLAQPYFLGDSFTSSKGFFPTELGFSERIIPTLTKLGIEWSVLGNVHYSRTLKDYPYLNDPGVDTLISPPNRADLQNESDIGDWVSLHMFNEQQVTQNKFPFASIPHWVQYVDPDTAETHQVAGIPVEQASSWEEGYQGSVTATALKPFESEAAQLGRTQYFVVAHDGDNSQGRAGDGGTWANSGNVTYSDAGVTGKGVAEYLKAHPIPANDIVHVQDGSWIDTRDSSADPTWYHWHLPMGVWNTQLAQFNAANGTDYPQLFAANGKQRSHMPSLELGYHYLERNFALLQAAENYAATAEQIWLDDHPNYWSPSTALDREITYPGNQLNPWMLSYPVKGDVNNDYAGGANPAELGWYFLIASIDSGFGYYDENVDDGVKPTISFNQSLFFTEPYVQANLAKDKTGPSLWWPQRYPYNPGSVNNSKAEGWATMYMNNSFAIYTYAYDVSDIASIKVKVRTHTNKVASPTDKTYQLYDPASHAADPNVDPSRVSDWTSYDMAERDLSIDINGVSWQPSSTEIFEIVPAKKIGNLHYTYFDDYRDQLLDYYIEAVDSKGNVTRSDIQQVYVGTGKYKMDAGKQVEDINGTIEGEEPFFTRGGFNPRPIAVISPSANQTVEPGAVVSLSASASSDDGEIVSYLWSTGETSENIQVTVNTSQTISLTVTDDGGATDIASVSLRLAGEVQETTLYYQDTQSWGQVCVHYSTDNEATWTTAPGDTMTPVALDWYVATIELELDQPLVFVTNNCSNAWDNNGGQDYRTNEGTWNVANGVLGSGVPAELDQNQKPIARISPSDQDVDPGTVLVLSAAGSSDSDGEITSYLWNTGETTSSITVVITENQIFTVTVTDNDKASASASVSIGVIVNQPPIAVILPGSQSVKVGTALTLSAAGSSDSDGQVMSYLWSNGATTSGTDVVISQTETFTVVVTDDDGATGTTSVTITAVPNQAPTAVILPGSGSYPADSMLTLDGSASSDSDGTISSYLWSTGATTPTINFTLTTDASITLTVTDNDGVSDSETVTLTIDDTFEQNLPSLFFRGTANAWSTQAMELVDDNLWQTKVVFDGQNNQRFKLDVNANWSKNYGDSNNDGVAELNGNDIFTSVVGTYFVTFNDETLAYRLIKEGGSTDLISNFTTLNFRGTANDWAATAMTLVANNVWETVIEFDGQSSQRFKFDVKGDWSQNFGDNNADGVLEQTGNDIIFTAIGSYTVQVNDASFTYRLIPIN